MYLARMTEQLKTCLDEVAWPLNRAQTFDPRRQRCPKNNNEQSQKPRPCKK